MRHRFRFKRMTPRVPTHGCVIVLSETSVPKCATRDRHRRNVLRDSVRDFTDNASMGFCSTQCTADIPLLSGVETLNLFIAGRTNGTLNGRFAFFLLQICELRERYEAVRSVGHGPINRRRIERLPIRQRLRLPREPLCRRTCQALRIQEALGPHFEDRGLRLPGCRHRRGMPRALP